jgi:hypothetical protein
VFFLALFRVGMVLRVGHRVCICRRSVPRATFIRPEYGVQDLPRTRGLAPLYASTIFDRQRRRMEVGIGETLKSAEREPFWAASHTLQHSPPLGRI